MREPLPITLEQLSDRYDVFFVDQFGVLRDDTGPYEGAIEALSRLATAGKMIVILSNSGRNGEYNSERLVKLGFAADSFDFFVTSGDVAYEVLSSPGSTIVRGSTCLTISSGGDRNLADRLGLVSMDHASEAQLIIISGSESERVAMDDYREMLRPAAEKHIPCICTNPDIHKLHNGATLPGAGSIARIYESMGGMVIWLGKPHPEIYAHALRLAGITDRRRVVCVGDSIDHDILGAKTSGLDSVLVRTGILSKESEEGLDRHFNAVGAFANYVIPRFGF